MHRHERISGHQAPTRAEMTAKLLSRFYSDEQAHLATNGLSTEILVFPSDLLMQNSKTLAIKMRQSLDYATRALDIYPLNALRHVAGNDADPLTFRALFLALSEEANRLGKPMSFLTALRKAGASLASDEPYNATRLANRVKDALSLLDMQSYAPLIDSWQKRGTFTLHNEFNGRDPNTGEYCGSYVALAHAINHGHSSGLNHTISFILGNKLRIEGENPQTMLSMARHYAGNPASMRERIMRGDNSRADTLHQAIDSLNIASPPTASSSAGSAILSYLPDSAIELLWREGYSIAHTSHGNDISSIYPKDDLPGISRADNLSAREGKALCQQRYHTIFLSHGHRLNPHDIDNPALTAQIAAQSLCHETAHLAFAHLSEEQKLPLREAIARLSSELNKLPPQELLDTPCTTIDTNSLYELLDEHSRHYANYRQNGSAWEEVACNLLGLLHTEYKDRQPELFAAIPTLLDSWNSLEHAIDLGLGQSRKNSAPIEPNRQHLR